MKNILIPVNGVGVFIKNNFCWIDWNCMSLFLSWIASFIFIMEKFRTEKTSWQWVKLKSIALGTNLCLCLHFLMKYWLCCWLLFLIKPHRCPWLPGRSELDRRPFRFVFFSRQVLRGYCIGHIMSTIYTDRSSALAKGQYRTKSSLKILIWTTASFMRLATRSYFLRTHICKNLEIEKVSIRPVDNWILN